MKYQKGSFITVPNSAGLHATAQCLFMWLCQHANQDGTCYPSRQRLAALCNVSVDMVDKMMKLLVSNGLVAKTVRKEPNKDNKTNIYEVLVGGVADTVGWVADTVGPELNPVILTQSKEVRGAATPAQTAQDFFNNFDAQERLANGIAEKYRIDPLAVRTELNKFISYWTEPNKSGSKVRWQMERTFELTRRLTTWFGRTRNFASVNRADKSKTIIGL